MKSALFIRHSSFLKSSAFSNAPPRPRPVRIRECGPLNDFAPLRAVFLIREVCSFLLRCSSFQPAAQESLAFAAWAAEDQVFHADILIEIGPVHTDTAADPTPVGAFSRRGMKEAREPGQRDGQGAPFLPLSLFPFLSPTPPPSLRGQTSPTAAEAQQANAMDLLEVRRNATRLAYLLSPDKRWPPVMATKHNIDDDGRGGIG